MQTLQFIGLNPEEYKKDLLQSFYEICLNLQQDQNPKQELELLTVKEVAHFFGASVSTIKRWTKTGKLPSYGIGNRVYYKRHEIEECLIDLTPKSHD